MNTKNLLKKMKGFALASCLAFASFSTFAQTSVTFKVDMNQMSGFTIPEVNGTFNGWCGAACNPLTDANSDGVWETTVSLAPGTYEYKFAADNWSVQEALTAGTSCTVTNGGFTNRSLTVGTTALVLPIVCWNSCSSCSAVTVPKNITFKVDMQQYAGVINTVNLNGDFNGWCGACTTMTDANADGIYEVTVPLSNDSIEYKFTVDGWNASETFAGGESCTKTTGGFTNRFLEISGDTVLPAVCYASCAACVVTKSITFKVNMSDYTGTYTDVNLNGTFNNWCGSCNTMTDANNDDIYEITLPLPVGAIEYKFTVDGWAASEQLTAGDACTITTGGFTNRAYTVANNDTLDVACWALCTDCPTGIDESFTTSFNVFPNPATTELSIATSIENGTAFITTILGEEVGSKVNLNTTKSLNIASLSPGIYYLNIETATQRGTVRFVKK
jgi:1,4-alpha-glucan branching enzyme